jgi:hypothetical protein
MEITENLSTSSPSQGESETSGGGGRKRKWTDDLDALLLREVKLQKPHSKHYGARGAAYSAIADSLNASGRLPWNTDKKHVQGRLSHLATARRAHQRTSARATGVEEEHGELEVLLDDIIAERDEFVATEADRRQIARAREDQLAEGGRRAREMAMRRQSGSIDDDAGLEGEASSDVPENAAEDRDAVASVAVRERRISTSPGSGGSTIFQNDSSVEGELLRLMQANANALSSDFQQRASTESRRLSFEIERENKQHEIELARIDIETRRAKTDEDREARFRRKEERDARLEELRIEAQQAQTTVLVKLAEMLQRRES